MIDGRWILGTSPDKRISGEVRTRPKMEGKATYQALDGFRAHEGMKETTRISGPPLGQRSMRDAQGEMPRFQR